MKNKLTLSSTRLTIALLIVFFPFSANAQVGINNNTPHSTAVLHLHAPNQNQGLLVPVVNNLFDKGPVVTPTYPGGEEPANGLMVSYSTENAFYYYHNGWHAINPFDRDKDSKNIATKSGDNIVVTKGNITLNNGNITVGSGTITANTFIGNGTMPVGGIIMWSGAIAAIPDGWALCNGGNGTPNLSSRFIVSYSATNNDYNAPGKTGGLSSVTLTANQSGLREHDHTIIDPKHSHSYVNYPSAGIHRRGNNSSAHSSDNRTATTNETVSQSTGITINPSDALDASDAHENRPPYYVLAFIMRIK